MSEPRHRRIDPKVKGEESQMLGSGVLVVRPCGCNNAGIRVALVFGPAVPLQFQMRGISIMACRPDLTPLSTTYPVTEDDHPRFCPFRDPTLRCRDEA